jgi:uncharacterized protein YfaS (alpha-2-macroglobulin family)
MNWKHCLAICLFVGILWASCSSKNILSIQTNFDNQHPELQQNLIFNFDKNLVADSACGKWDSTKYFEIQPKVDGVFKWNTPSELSFSPSSGFAPETKYTIKWNTTALTKNSSEKLDIKEGNTIEFSTAPLKIIQSNISWQKSVDQATVVLQIDLDFNYEIQANDITPLLQISQNGSNKIIHNLGNTSNKSISIQFAPDDNKDEESKINVALKSGAKILHVNHTSKTDTTYTQTISSRYQLDINNIQAQHNGSEGFITVQTSQPISEQTIQNAVDITPNVKFQVSKNSNGFSITSDLFKPDQVYTLTINKTLEGNYGGKLKDEVKEPIHFGKLAPMIQFANTKGQYLSSQGLKNVALNIVNVPEVTVTIIKVYENNIQHFLSKGKSYDYNYDYETEEGGSYEYYSTEGLGDTVFTKTYKTNELKGKNASKLLHLDFQDKIKSFDGLYVVQVQSDEHFWIQDSKIISLSDIGLIVKEDEDKIIVFTNSIKTTRPLSGVKLNLISTNNQKLYTTTTNDQGIAEITKTQIGQPTFKVGMVTAYHNNEFSCIAFNKTSVELSRFDISGRNTNVAQLNAMLYAERNLYRPGETLHISTIIRDENWKPVHHVPIKFKVIMPNGKELNTFRKTLNEEGGAEISIPTTHSFITGTYNIQLFSANDIMLQNYYVSIEEFMPDRMKVEVKTNKTTYYHSDSIIASIQADNLFGTPAANRKYDIDFILNKKAFKVENLKEYDFNIESNFNQISNFKSGITNSNGNSKETFSLDPSVAAAGFIEGTVAVSAFDETGRPVHRYSNFEVFTQSNFIGLKNTDAYANINSKYTLPIVVVNQKGNIQNNVKVTATILKKEWNTVIEQYGNSYRYSSQKDEKVISTSTIEVSGSNSAFSFIPTQSGEYEIRFSFSGGKNFVSKTIYAYGSGNAQYNSFEVNNEGNVTIKTNQDKYKIGDEIELLFTTPFDGKMLVCIERNKVLEHQYVQVVNKSAKLTIKCTEQYLPNVYVAATLFRPMGVSDLPLTVAHGYHNIAVTNPSTILPLQMQVTQQSRSKSTQKVTIKTSPNAYVTIAAVDEGILQVKNYVTPDPHKYFYQKMALNVSNYDIYPFLLPELLSNKSSTGGDGVGEANLLRVNPKFVNRVKLVSYWSGILKADGNGIIKYDLNIPQFSGDLRIMALAYKGNAFASIDNHMKITDPLIISSGVPRFLSPNDKVTIPVTISNTTNQSANTIINITTNSLLEVVGGNQQQINIPANSEARVIFHVASKTGIGSGQIKVTAKGLNETFEEAIDISIRPSASLQKITGFGVISEQQPLNLNWASNNQFIPSTFSGKLTISKSPILQLGKNLDYLIQYPHGCVEQITSAAFPQIYWSAISSQIANTFNNSTASNNVQQAINKLQSMQLTNGALTYWPGGGYESWWGTAYAAHFLLEAQKMGYDVNATTLKKINQYLKSRLQKKEKETWWFNQTQKKEIVARETIYSLYVLALMQDAPINTMNYYKANKDQLSTDSKYLLAATFALQGLPKEAKLLLPPSFGNEQSNNAFGGNFYSYTRDLAIALHSLTVVNPADPQVLVLSRTLLNQLTQKQYLSTQESSFGILALGKLMKQNADPNTILTLNSGKANQEIKDQIYIYDLKEVDLKTPIKGTVKGKGNFYYFWEKSGIDINGKIIEEDKFLKVRRTFFNRNGQEIKGLTFNQNDLIVVRVSISSAYNVLVENVVITDMLAAGFEVENTRLYELPEYSWIKDDQAPDHIDYRDDRVNLFVSAGNDTRNYYYMIRAVSPGKYQLGPIQADAMYDGNFHSYNGSGLVTIEE